MSGSVARTLKEVRMADRFHVEVARAGSDAVRRWRIDHPSETFDLCGADLPSLLWHGVDLSCSIVNEPWQPVPLLPLAASVRTRAIPGLNCSGAVLRCAQIRGCSLEGSLFPGAQLNQS